MKNLVVILSILFASASFCWASETVVLSPGRWKEWPVPRAIAVSVSNGSVVRVRDQGRSLKITGLKRGHVELRIGSSKVHVHVVSEAERSLHEAIQQSLENKRGLILDFESLAPGANAPRLRIRGRLLSWDDWQDLATATQGSEAEYLFEANLSPEVQEIAQREFQTRLREAKLPEVSISLNGPAEASLPTDASEMKARVARVLGPFGIRVSQNPGSISLEPMVKVRLLVTEFQKSWRRQLGIKWPEALEAQILPRASVDNLKLDVSLQALEDNGAARVLASPTLLCRSGKEAQFLAGGEIPIKIASRKERDVVWKKFGILLKISPKADFSGRMSVGIAAEVSSIDMANAVDGLPGFASNRIETHFDLSSSRTIVLSGLIKKQSGDSTSGLPGLKNLPILGALFSSRHFQENESELVVFVTPEIATPDASKPMEEP